MVNPLDFIRTKKIDYKSAEEEYKNKISELDPEVQAFYLGYTDNINVKEEFSNNGKHFSMNSPEWQQKHSEKSEQAYTSDNKSNISYVGDGKQSVNGTYGNNQIPLSDILLSESEQKTISEWASDNETVKDSPISSFKIPEFIIQGSIYGNFALPSKKEKSKSEKEILEELKKDVNDKLGDVAYSQRVSLNVAPINKIVNVSNFMTTNDWSSRLNYILGDSGLLRYLFYNTKGIVFPYTPDIDFNHQISYEETSIPHSNLNVQHYKNTPPPTIQLSADFTADTLENGLYMYGVIHFLRSVSKCEFGEEVVKDSNKDRAGVPPPILYLNGWGNFMINIPVVIKNFGIKLGNNKHYVHIYKPSLNVDVWMPTDITITINMAIQFNLDKYKMKFDLNKYKRGILGTEENSNFAVDKKYDIVYDRERLDYMISSKNGLKYSITKEFKTKESQDIRKFNGAGWTW